VHGLRGWKLLHEHRRTAGGDVSCVPDQHVFWVIGVLVPGVPGERDVGGGECLAGILLLQERVCAFGGLVHVSYL